MTIPPSLSGLLDIFGACFTKPTFHTFTGLVTGLIAQTPRVSQFWMIMFLLLPRPAGPRGYLRVLAGRCLGAEICGR